MLVQLAEKAVNFWLQLPPLPEDSDLPSLLQVPDVPPSYDGSCPTAITLALLFSVPLLSPFCWLLLWFCWFASEPPPPPSASHSLSPPADCHWPLL